MRQKRIATLLLIFAATGYTQQSEEWRSWNRPVKPFRMIGNIYYVGASGVTSFLITAPQGHIVVDGGFAETAPMILKNIRTLGFNPQDVKYIVFSHAHSDHVGGLAELKRATGAELLSSRQDAPVLRSGGKGDFTFGDRVLFPAVEPDRMFFDGEEVSLGAIKLTAHVTAGHTKGCTSWTMPVQEGGRTFNVLFHCSTTVPGHKLVNNAAYREIVTDYEASFRTLRALPCDVLLAPHAGFFHLEEKRGRMQRGGPNPFVDAQECKTFIEQSAESFHQELEKQRKGG